MRRFAGVVAKRRPEWVIADAPEEAALEEGLQLMKAYQVIARISVVTSWFGDRVAKRRVCIVLTRNPAEGQTKAFLAFVQAKELAAPETLAAILLPTDAIESQLWESPEQVKHDPRAHPHTDKFLPHGTGTWTDSTGQKRFIYATTGPAPNMSARPTDELGYGNALVADTREPHKLLRRLAPFEVFRAHGHPSRDWEAACSQGRSVQDIMNACAQALPMATAAVLVQAVASLMTPTRAGVGFDRDEEEARELMREWMRCWRRQPESPGELYRDWLAER